MSLSYSHYAQDDYYTTENITVSQWKNEYENYLGSDLPVDYAGYVYDAVWMYAYALDQLLKENKAYVVNFQNPMTYK